MTWSQIIQEYLQDGTDNWLSQLLGVLEWVLWVALIYVGVKMARAESSDQREEAKKRLINIIVAVVVTIALILFFNLLLPLILDATGVFESAFGDPGAGGESLAVMAKTLLRI